MNKAVSEAFEERAWRGANLAPLTGPIHLHPTAPLADRVLLPGDPGRALLLAQALLAGPRMFNHNRGLWGYTGRAGDGRPLTIQSTGMGGPSAAIVISELAEMGAEVLMRVGTCGAIHPALELGDLVIAREAIPADGTSRALGADARVRPDRALFDALAATGKGRAATIVSTDLFYGPHEGQEQRWREAGAAAVEMETASLYVLAERNHIRAASLLAVSDLLSRSRVRIDAAGLRKAEQRLGEVAMRALQTLD
jgi:DeoD family purine-nucleoside phosphorylase